nr:arginase family protein [Phytoactinopolyspora mesophila]
MAELYRHVAEAVATDVRTGTAPVVQSGDCMVSLGTVAGVQQAGVSPSVVWFDAHGDVQTLETTTSGYLGGMPIRVLTGYRPELIAEPLGLQALAEEQVLLVDARDLDPPEAEFLASSPMTRCPVDDVSEAVIPAGPLVLHVDFDVVNPDQLPGTLFPTPGGPGIDAVMAAVARVLDTGRVVALSLGCTWHPGQGTADQISPHLESALAPGR